MKKYIVSLLFAAAFVSQAYAECNVGTNGTTSCCWWNATSCWGIGGQYDDMKTDADCRASSGFPQSNCNAPSIEYCNWGPEQPDGTGGCFPIKDDTERSNCSQNGSIVTSCPTTGGGTSSNSGGGGQSSPSGGGGSGTHCCWPDNADNNNNGYCGPVSAGGTATTEGTAAYCTANYGTLMNGCSGCSASRKDDAESCGSWCKWPDGCIAINTDPTGKYGTVIANCPAAIANCETNSMRYSDASCSNFIGGRDPSRTALGCCRWDNPTENPNRNCYTIWSDDVGAQTKVSDCQTGTNQYWNGECISSGDFCPSGPPISSIRKLSLAATSNIVKAIHNGVNVQLMDNAKIQVYDLKGNLVRSLELAKGSYNVELSNMPRGTYIVRVNGRSLKQTITVPVK